MHCYHPPSIMEPDNDWVTYQTPDSYPVVFPYFWDLATTLLLSNIPRWLAQLATCDVPMVISITSPCFTSDCMFFIHNPCKSIPSWNLTFVEKNYTDAEVTYCKSQPHLLSGHLLHCLLGWKGGCLQITQSCWKGHWCFIERYWDSSWDFRSTTSYLLWGC